MHRGEKGARTTSERYHQSGSTVAGAPKSLYVHWSDCAERDGMWERWCAIRGEDLQTAVIGWGLSGTNWRAAWRLVTQHSHSHQRRLMSRSSLDYRGGASGSTANSLLARFTYSCTELSVIRAAPISSPPWAVGMMGHYIGKFACRHSEGSTGQIYD